MHQSELKVEHAFCSRCGRLLADESGDVCDQCEPAHPPISRPSAHLSLTYAPATWILIALNLVVAVGGWTFVSEHGWLGSMYGPTTMNGAWWQLVTSMFVHLGFVHLADNMFFLWFFGKRAERIFGTWNFLAIYFLSGLSGGVTALAFRPEVHAGGASDAIFGIIGSLVVFYSLHFKKLTGRQWVKFSLLCLWMGVNFYGSYSDPTIGYSGHVGGLLAGAILGAIVHFIASSTRRARILVFSAAAAVVCAAAFAVREHNFYVVHLDRADRALHNGQQDVASKEVHAALDSKPGSALAKSFTSDLERYPAAHNASCLSLPLNPYRPSSIPEPCSQFTCDWERHKSHAPDGAEVYYTGTVETSKPVRTEDGFETSRTETLKMQAIDEFGEVACATSWERLTTQALDAQGRPRGAPVKVFENVLTDSQLNPIAKPTPDQLQDRSSKR